MKHYFDLSLVELNASKLHKLKLEYNTICQLKNEEINWFNKKCTNNLTIQLEFNDDFASNSKPQTSTPKCKNDSFRCNTESIEKFDKSIPLCHENATQTEIIIEECTGNVEIFMNKVEIDNYDEEKVEKIRIQHRNSVKAKKLSVDSGISGDSTLNDQQSTENKTEMSKNDKSFSDQNTEEESNYNDNVVREKGHSHLLANVSNENSLDLSSVSKNQIYKEIFLKKLLRFLLSFLLVCAILITVIYPLIKPTCNNGRKEYFLKYFYVDEENVNKWPTVY